MEEYLEDYKITWKDIKSEAKEVHTYFSGLYMSLMDYQETLLEKGMECDKHFDPVILENFNEIIKYIEKTFNVSELHVKQKPIFTPEGEKIYVDPYMIPILTHLWSRGVKTIFSCSGHFPDWSAYLVIERNKEFEKYAKKSKWENSIRKDIFNDFAIHGNLKCFSSNKKIRDQFLEWLLAF